MVPVTALERCGCVVGNITGFLAAQRGNPLVFPQVMVGSGWWWALPLAAAVIALGAVATRR